MNGTETSLGTGERERTGGVQESLRKSRADRRIFNWLWLANLPHRGTVLLIADDADSWARALAPHFETVSTLESARDLTRWTERDFDCVIHLPDLAREHVADGTLRRLARDARRALRPGGCLYVAVEGRVVTLDEPRILEGEGFCSVRAYYSTESADGLRFLVPARRRATAAFERYRGHASSRTARLKSGLAGLGLHPLLYRRRVFLGYR